ncbi:MAG: LysR family transcriptional regulator [Pyrinomonadaceae bacterium]
MEIRQLKAFLVIAETQTFTAGARRLNITQAAISMQIRQLEDELGIQLFTRTPRKVIITEAGQILLERARTILNEHDGAICQIAEIAGGEYGRLRIGTASGMFASNQLPGIIREIKKIKPKIDLTVQSGTSHELVDRLMNGDIDSAFVSLPVDNLNIQTMTLFTDELVAIAHPKHPMADERHMTASALGREQLILGEQGGNTRRMIDEYFSAAGERPTIIMELARQDAINQMVATGLGVGLAGQKQVSRDVRDGRLITWPLKGTSIKWELGLARLRGGHFSPIAKEFERLCKESFADREKELKSSQVKR